MSSHDEIRQAYFNHLQSYLPISEQTLQLMGTIISTGVLKKGEFSLVEGKVSTHIDFIYKGAFRVFSNKDGFEITTGIFLENKCVTNMKSFSTGIPSTVSIQALEDVHYARIKSKELQELYHQSAELQSVGRAILEGMIVEENDWKEMYTLYDPEERYLFLSKKAPEILQRVPLQIIASFLGMRRETLSRIRNRTARQG